MGVVAVWLCSLVRGSDMQWMNLCRPVRMAILREAVRRGVNVEDFAATLGVR